MSVSVSARLSTMHTNTTWLRCTLNRKTKRRLCCLTSTVQITTPSLWTHTAGHRTPWTSRTCDFDSLPLNSICCCGDAYYFCIASVQKRHQWLSHFCFFCLFLSFINVIKSLPSFQTNSGHYNSDVSIILLTVENIKLYFSLSVLYFLFLITSL